MGYARTAEISMTNENKSLTLLIDEHLKREQEEHSKRERSGKISPSFMGRCYRASMWNRANKPQSNPPDARTLRIFKCGNLFHSFAQQLLANVESIKSEVNVDKEDVYGYADIVSVDKKTVWDIKTVHSKAFWWMNRDNFDVVKDKEQNILQLMTYVYLLGLETGVLVFISKDDMCTSEYAFHINNWKDKVELELNTLKTKWIEYNNGVLPPPEPRAYGGKEGNYCPYRTTCLSLNEPNNPCALLKTKGDD